jgi:hypothetical protein
MVLERVAGYRWHKDGEGVGSMLLGLCDDKGELNHVGVAASFTAKLRKQLIDDPDDARAEPPQGRLPAIPTGLGYAWHRPQQPSAVVGRLRPRSALDAWLPG